MAEIIELEHEVIVATVEETSGAATGTKVVSNHSVSGANQHTIGAITGLEDRLQTIEALKDTIGVKRVGHADYYQWGEEATDANPLTWGYFVRLDNNGRIHKCTAETTVIPESALRLETKSVENIDVWDEASKNPNMIYYVNEETYYNYQGDEWVPYTNLDDITYDNMVIKYVYAGNITTADMDKYYVVGKLAPYDIYAYDGVQYVKKATYSYEDGIVSRTCNAIDVFGVTVNEAGFVGAHTQDDTYALVATTGLVDVLCRSGVVEGDYVYPTVGGIADKADSTYGYSVTKIWSDGTNSYARIVLAHSIEHSKSIAKNVDYLLTEAQRLDGNITTFGNTAEAALKRAEELTEAAQQSANTSSQVAQDATNAAVDAQKSAADAWGVAEQVIPSAQQAVADAKAAQESALALRDDTIASANETAAQIATGKSNETLNTVRTLEYNLDKYTIGQYSQAYGLTFAQAKAILPVGTTFIPMDEDPLATGARQEYREVYAGGEDPDVEQVFTVGYAYVWTNDGWLVDASHPTVLITREFTEQTEGDYWFVVKEYEGTEYNGGSLYRWQEGGWKEVAIRKENTMNRTIAHLCHEDDTIRQSVSSVDGKVAAVETRVTETDARVGLVASVPTELEGVKPGNYNEETEKLDVIVDKTALDQDWTDKAVDGKYYVVGSKLPYEVYQWNGSEFISQKTITYDGVGFYKINIASIITAANEDGSSVQLNATKINFTADADYSVIAEQIILEGTDINLDGYVTFENLKEVNTKTIINGGNITTGTIDTDRLNVSQIITVGTKDITTITEGTINTTKIVAENLQVKAANIDGKLTADKIDATGIEATGVNISGTVTAKRGVVGGWDIEEERLVGSNSEVGLCAPLFASELVFPAKELDDWVALSSITDEDLGETTWKATVTLEEEYVQVSERIDGVVLNDKELTDDFQTIGRQVVENCEVIDHNAELRYDQDIFVVYLASFDSTNHQIKYKRQFDIYCSDDTGELTREVTYKFDIPTWTAPATCEYVCFFAGASESSDAPFSITNTGCVKAADVNVSGGLIGGLRITDNTISTKNNKLRFGDDGTLYGENVQLQGTIGAQDLRIDMVRGAAHATQIFTTSSESQSVTKEYKIDLRLKQISGQVALEYLMQFYKRNSETNEYEPTTDFSRREFKIDYNYSNDFTSGTFSTGQWFVNGLAGNDVYAYSGYFETDSNNVYKYGHNLDQISNVILEIDVPDYGMATFANIGFGEVTSVNGGTIMWNASELSTEVQTTTKDNLVLHTDLLPDKPQTINLGNTDYPWKKVYAQDTETEVQTSSDFNFKNSIQTLEPKYEAIFDALHPVTFKYNNGVSGRTHMGLIAQDVEEAANNAGISVDDFAAVCINEVDGEKRYGLRYSEFIALCIDQIQKLKTRATEQENTINDLTNRLTALEEKLK